jgi:hypothetical protein
VLQWHVLPLRAIMLRDRTQREMLPLRAIMLQDRNYGDLLHRREDVLWQYRQLLSPEPIVLRYHLEREMLHTEPDVLQWKVLQERSVPIPALYRQHGVRLESWR